MRIMYDSIKRSTLLALAASMLALVPYGGDAFAGLGYVPGQLVYELDVGDSQTMQLSVILDTVGDLEVFATGAGAEFLTFEEYIAIGESHESFPIDVTVSIPDDYACGRYLEPDVFVRQIGSSDGLTVIQEQVFTPARITILDAPENPDPGECADLRTGGPETVPVIEDVREPGSEPVTLEILRDLIEDLRDTIEAQFDVMDRMADSIAYWQAEVAFLAQDVEDLTERNEALVRENEDLKRLLEQGSRMPEHGQNSTVSVTVRTDRDLYTEGDTIVISGRAENHTGPVVSDVNIMVKNPDGNVVTISQIIPDGTGTYTTALSTKGDLWALAGEYAVEAYFGPLKTTTTLEMAQMPERRDNLTDVTITVRADQTHYTRGDIVTITGTVSEIIPEHSITVVVKNPDGDTVSVRQVEAGTYRTYATTILAEDQLWKDGKYTIEANYGSQKGSTTFSISDVSITVRTDQTHYTRDDTITITGTVSEIIPEYPVTVMVIGPDSNIPNISQTEVGADMTYVVTISITDLFVQDGEYTVKAQYVTSSLEATTTFEVGTSTPTPAG